LLTGQFENDVILLPGGPAPMPWNLVLMIVGFGGVAALLFIRQRLYR
jgi:hypothetical protein